jgi:hypothetical protein
MTMKTIQTDRTAVEAPAKPSPFDKLRVRECERKALCQHRQKLSSSTTPHPEPVEG